MSEIVAILATICFFVTFGFAQRMGSKGPTGCDSCDAENASECAECADATATGCSKSSDV